MKLKFCLACFLLINCRGGIAQVNLIQNGSFEVLHECPYILPTSSGVRASSVQFAVGWRNPVWEGDTSRFCSPDLFQICAQMPLSVPWSFQGYQQPDSGNGYAGIGLGGFTEQGFDREFIQTVLSKPVFTGKKYRLSFDFVFGEYNSYKCNYLGLGFSGDSINIPDSASYVNEHYFPNLLDSAIVYFDELLQSDSTNWMHYSKEFIAKVVGNYLTIGNFKNHNETTYEFGWIRSNGGGESSDSYGLLDNISLVCLDSINCDSAVVINEIEKQSLIHIYPNPSNTSLTIQSSAIKPGALLFLNDLSGRLIQKIALHEFENFQLNTQHLANGTYWLSIQGSDGKQQQERFIVMHE